jgi:hypothetical protein
VAEAPWGHERKRTVRGRSSSGGSSLFAQRPPRVVFFSSPSSCSMTLLDREVTNYRAYAAARMRRYLRCFGVTPATRHAMSISVISRNKRPPLECPLWVKAGSRDPRWEQRSQLRFHVGTAISQTSPSERQSKSTLPPSGMIVPSMRRLPKPLRSGALTLGPPNSVQRSASCPS